MWTRHDDGLGTLTQVVADTTVQLQRLIEQVAELSTVVRVEDVRRAELERRVATVEDEQRGNAEHTVRVGDQWRLLFGNASVSAFFSVVVSLLVHVLWR